MANMLLQVRMVVYGIFDFSWKIQIEPYARFGFFENKKSHL
jgi:hypothetical protein